MKEAEWNRCTDPQAMLTFLRESGKLSGRKARLLAAACCRRIWPLLTEERSRRAVGLAEKYADGPVDWRERHRAEYLGAQAASMLSGDAWLAALAAKMTLARHIPLRQVLSCTPADNSLRAEENELRRREQAHLVRDLFGPLAFRPMTLPASVRTWNEGILPRLAREAYEQRQLPSGQLDNARLAVLADALEEAGVMDEDILGHLRQQGAVHVRGCFLLDLLLGKE